MSRKLAAVAAVLGVALLALVLWFAAEPRPDAATFMARRGAIVSVVAEPEIPEAAGFISQNVRILSDTGIAAELRVLRPTDDDARLPLIVLLGGHRTGRDAVRLLGAPGPFVVAALNYPYKGPERPRGFWQSLGVIGPARKALMETPATVLLATEWLLEQPWVDSDRAEIAGASLGMPFAAIAGALEPRFQRVWLIQGAADLRAWIEHNLIPKVNNGILRRFTARLIHRLARGSMFEPGHWAPQISPRQVVIVAAHGDGRLPVALVEQLDAVIPEPKEMIWIEGDHLGRKPETVRDILQMVRDHIRVNVADEQ